MRRTGLLCNLITLVFLLATGKAWAVLPQGNPIDGDIPSTFWSVELEDVVTIPNSSGRSPRLEFLTGGGAPGLNYVIDQRGKIYSFNPADANPTPTVFLDLSTSVPGFQFAGQKGVRGLAFHPDFNSAGTDGFRKFYTSHSIVNTPIDPSDNTRIFNSPPGLDHDSSVAEWMVDGNGDVITGSFREIMRVGQPEVDHNIGQISFNPNATPGHADYGNLYIALGDGGGAGNPNNTAQNISIDASAGNPTGFPHGSILRIDPLINGNEPYSIPDDNPFEGQANTIEEVWAYGLRNPHHFAFDTAGDGKLLISDIGQGNVEEINLGLAGANYGWSESEGSFASTAIVNRVDDLPGNHPSDEFTYPVAQYDRDSGIGDPSSTSWAVTGGSVYRGTAVPQLTGLYLFGDFATNTGPIFAVDVDDLVQREDFSDLESLNDGLLAPLEQLRLTDGGTEKTLLQIIRDESNDQSLSRTDLRFGVGADNEIYVLNKRDGTIRRFVSASGLLDGDQDRDGDVDGSDFLDWQLGFATPQGDWSDGDFDGNAIVDGLDLDLWARQFGGVTPLSAAVVVPEPTALSLCLLSALVTTRRRRP